MADNRRPVAGRVGRALGVIALVVVALLGSSSAAGAASHAGELRVAASGQRPAALPHLDIRHLQPVSSPSRVVTRAARPAAPSPRPSPGGVSVQVDGGSAGRSQAVSIIILLTVLSIAPALLLLTTSFTKMVVVLSLTRNALGTPTIPPNQVLVGLALFLSIFVMSPVLSQVNEQAVQPFLKGTITEAQAFDRGSAPLRTFMLKQTGRTELQTMIKLSKEPQPATEKDVSMTTLVPAFILSELKAAFIIGFVIFIPFLVIDLVVSSALMSMGMMMLPPIMISLPFKLLLFVMVDGWSLITTSLVTSYH